MLAPCKLQSTAGLIRRSQVAGHRSQVSDIIRKKQKSSLFKNNFSHIQLSSSNKQFVFNSFFTAFESLMVSLLLFV